MITVSISDFRQNLYFGRRFIRVTTTNETSLFCLAMRLEKKFIVTLERHESRISMIYSEKYFHQKTVRTAAPPRKQEPYTKDGTEGRRCFSVNENSINLDSKPCSKIK